MVNGIEYYKMFFCGYKYKQLNYSNIDGETLSNILILEFHSDDHTNDPYRDYLGFNITYVQRKRKNSIHTVYCQHSGDVALILALVYFLPHWKVFLILFYFSTSFFKLCIIVQIIF